MALPWEHRKGAPYTAVGNQWLPRTPPLQKIADWVMPGDFHESGAAKLPPSLLA